MPTYVKAVMMHGHRLYTFGYNHFNRNMPVFGYLNMQKMQWTKLTAIDGQIEDNGKLVFIAPYDATF